MGQFISKFFLIFTFCAPLYIWGLAYEYSYFRVLNLDVFEIYSTGIFSPLYYIFNPIIYILGCLIFLIVVTQLMKFFSSNIEKDEWKSQKKIFDNSKSNDLINLARFGFILCLMFWLYMFIAIEYVLSTTVGGAFLFMILCCVSLSYPGIYKTNLDGKTSIITSLIFSIGLCFSAGGYSAASNDLKKKGVIRDDYIVRVFADGHGFKAKSKPIPTPLLSFIKNALK